MKIKILILFSILSLFSYSFLSANPIDSSLARIVAENFYKQNNCIGVKNGISIRVNKTTKSFYLEPNNGGYHNFYIFNANGGTGFIIVAADNCCYPIIGYSDIGNLNLGDMPIQLQEWLNGYEREIEFMVEHNVASTDDIASAWELLSNGQNTTVRNTQSVSPLIQTTWDQIYPYNTLCPSSNYSAQPYMGHCLTGCAATAMAQIMNYWEYPNSGNGNNSYFDTCSQSVLAANFETLYMWNEMPNNLSPNSTIMQQLAVATLMSHCGVSLNLCYGELESSAIPVYVPFSFETYFDYEVDTILLKDSYTSSAWISILKNELDAGRPIFYLGHGSAGGHAFICDGYTTSNYFHFNWGWGGQCDGYFSVSLLNPSTHNYSSNQACVIGIEPSNINTPPGYDLVMNSSISTNNSNYDMGDPIIVSRSIKNSGSSTFSGYIIVTLTNIDDGYTVANSCNYLNLPVNQINTVSVTFPGSSSFTPGNYIVTVYSATDTGDVNTYRLIRDNASNQNFAQFTISYSASIEVYDDCVLSTGESLYSGESATIYTSVLNTANATFTGNVAVALLDNNGNFQQMIGQISLSNGLSHNYYTNLTFSGNITVPSGVYFTAHAPKLCFRKSYFA